MPSHKTPDICFNEKTSKAFNFVNNTYELKLNEIYDKSFYKCLDSKIDEQTTLVINTDKNSNKNIISYVVLNDIKNIENIIIKSYDNINLIWQEDDKTIYPNKNYIIQFTQIDKTTVIAKLTNTTLMSNGTEDEPEPTPVKELSAIYFAMPEQGTTLYEMFNWYNEKKDIKPNGAIANSEVVKFVIPQNINGNIIWKSFTNYTILDNLIKVPLENIYEKYFLDAVQNGYKTFFKLRVFYEAEMTVDQRIEVDYPLIWDVEYNKTGYCRIILKNAMGWIDEERVRTSISCLTIYDNKNERVAYCKGTAKDRSRKIDWSEMGGINPTLVTLYANGVTGGSGATCEGINEKNVCFKRGFTLDTNWQTDYTKVSFKNAAYFQMIGSTAILDRPTNKPYMPYGDMTLNHVKFEYKEVE